MPCTSCSAWWPGGWTCVNELQRDPGGALLAAGKGLRGGEGVKRGQRRAAERRDRLQIAPSGMWRLCLIKSSAL